MSGGWVYLNFDFQQTTQEQLQILILKQNQKLAYLLLKQKWGR